MEFFVLILCLAVLVWAIWGFFWNIERKDARKDLNQKILAKLEKETVGEYSFKSLQRYLTFGDLGGHTIGFVNINSSERYLEVFSADLPDLLEDYDLSKVSSSKFSFDKFEEVEVLNNGNTFTKTNRGSQAAGAAVGAALLGPAGLLVGGLSGSTTGKEKIEQVKIRLRFQDDLAPLQEIVIFNSEIKGGIKADSVIVTSALKPADELVARLKNVLAENARQSDFVSKPASSDSIASELQKLHELLQSGAISEDEFRAIKQKVIG